MPAAWLPSCCRWGPSRSPSAWASSGSGSSGSRAATTATSRTRPSRRAGPSSSSWRCSVARRPRRARSGGPRVTAATTATPTRKATSIPRARASGTPTRAGSSKIAGRRTELERIRDFASYPELVWLNRWHVVVPIRPGRRLLRPRWAAGARLGLLHLDDPALARDLHDQLAGPPSGAASATRPATTAGTTSSSRCSPWARAGTTTTTTTWPRRRQGFFWWEIDITYYVLRGLQAVGLVWDIREPPAQVVRPTKTVESSRLAA